MTVRCLEPYRLRAFLLRDAARRHDLVLELVELEVSNLALVVEHHHAALRRGVLQDRG